jgi:predicted AAA+ superfamily ATPase
MIDWTTTYAAIYRAKKESLKPVKYLDEISLNDLVGIAFQKGEIINNTQRFLNNLPSNNVLLWGARGTGKSSMIKALLNEFKGQSLRLIEIDRDDLDDLIEIADEIRELPYKFIIFCDDLSFEEGEKGYKGLKRILEGSIEKTPENIKIYATSNRRHLITEYQRDNEGTKVGNNGEIHYSDSVEEKISLSDRFGLSLGFYHGSQQEYLTVVESYFKNYEGDKEELQRKALQFAQRRASKSARTAKQFYNSFTKESL